MFLRPIGFFLWDAVTVPYEYDPRVAYYCPFEHRHVPCSITFIKNVLEIASR